VPAFYTKLVVMTPAEISIDDGCELHDIPFLTSTIDK
jgi:hypothetical protein